MTAFPILFAILFACSVKPTGTKPATEPLPGTVNKILLLQLVNDARKKGCNCGNTYYPPAPAVTWNDKLELAARNHSEDMQKNHFFNHTNKKGESAGTRIKAAGYQWMGYGENIAEGYGSEQAVIQGWLKSPGHCSDLMSKTYLEMGVGRAGGYWTQVMATGK